MDCYEIWFDLKDTSRDLEFCRDLAAYMGHLRERGLIVGYRLTRRKLGFGPSDLGEFHAVIETEDMAQLQRAFDRVATRDPEVEQVHGAVYSAVKNARFALYRDFPDPVRDST